MEFAIQSRTVSRSRLRSTGIQRNSSESFFAASYRPSTWSALSGSSVTNRPVSRAVRSSIVGTFSVEQLDQSAACLPQLRQLPLGDQLAEDLDRRALRAD